MSFVSIGAKQKPVLDESSFQQLLAAAYVVQKHNDSLWANIPQLDTAQVLSEIAEMQTAAHAGRLDLHVGAKLITEHLLQMVAATGVSLSLINDGFLDCVAESGVPAKVPGSSIASHSLVATERLKSGEVFDSGDSPRDIRLDAAMCSRVGVGSLIAAPVVRFGQLSGLIEVRWARSHAFNETGLLASRLMASMVAGILERQVAPTKQVLTEVAKSEPVIVSELRADPMRAATQVPAESSTVEGSEPEFSENRVEIVQPPVLEPQAAQTPVVATANAGSHSTETQVPETVVEAPVETSVDEIPAQQNSAEVADTAAPSCRVCGRRFGADEAFCGHCSMPRAAANPLDEMQSKWASLWFIQKAQGALTEKEAETERDDSAAVTTRAAECGQKNASHDYASTAVDEAPVLQPRAAEASAADLKDHFSYFEPAQFERNAATETEFWERAAAVAAGSKSFLRKLRAKDIALVVIAAALTFGVVSAWPSSTGKLTWFGSMVVRLGLARHSVPSYAGNPAINVWVDEQTSLYYCPGADLYGKTSAGHFATQLEAEQAQFHSASGLVCE